MKIINAKNLFNIKFEFYRTGVNKLMKFKNKSISKAEGIQALFIGILVTSGGLAGLSTVVNYKTTQTVCGVTFGIAAIIVSLLILQEGEPVDKE